MPQNGYSLGQLTELYAGHYAPQTVGGVFLALKQTEFAYMYYITQQAVLSKDEEQLQAILNVILSGHLRSRFSEKDVQKIVDKPFDEQNVVQTEPNNVTPSLGAQIEFAVGFNTSANATTILNALEQVEFVSMTHLAKHAVLQNDLDQFIAVLDATKTKELKSLFNADDAAIVIPYQKNAAAFYLTCLDHGADFDDVRRWSAQKGNFSAVEAIDVWKREQDSIAAPATPNL